MIDALKGILGNTQFRERLEAMVKAEETLTLAQLDLDGFMGLNDQFGQAAGDRLLEALMTLMAKWAEERGWTAGRIGGDEFTLAMPGVPLEKGFLAMDEFRRAVLETFQQVLPDGADVTASIGMANVPRDAKDARTLMSKADHALYQAKEAGRNQVSLPWNEELVLRSCYYSTSQLGRLKRLAEVAKKKESVLLREALDDLLRKYDV